MVDIFPEFQPTPRGVAVQWSDLWHLLNPEDDIPKFGGCAWFVLRIVLTHWGRDKIAAPLADDIFKCNFVDQSVLISINIKLNADDVITWKHFPRYCPFVREIHRSLVNSRHKDQWRGALGFSFICAWINGWINNHEAGDLRRHRAHHDVIVMCCSWGSN